MRYAVSVGFFLAFLQAATSISRAALFSLLGNSPEGVCDCVPFYQCRTEDKMEYYSGCGPTEVCCRKDSIVDDVCGWAPKVTGGGHEAGYGEFPWMVAVLHVNVNDTWTHREYVAGGSIIRPAIVLTAAHKISGRKPSSIKCRAGEWIRTELEHYPHQDRLVKEIHVHHDFDRFYMANDVAVLRLLYGFNTSLPTVRPVCRGRGAPPPGAPCFAAGWGRVRFNDTEYADKLKKALVPPIPRAVCWHALQAVDAARRKRDGDSEKLMLHSSLMCAGGEEGQDMCIGDGGSPLVCQIQANSTHIRYAQYGVVAWGVRCGEEGVPGVYADITIHSDWDPLDGKRPEYYNRSTIIFSYE